MDLLKFCLEFLITYALIMAFYYFFSIKKYKEDSKNIPTEVNIILVKNKIDAKKVDVYQIIKVVCFVTAFILALSVSLMSILSKSIIVSVIVGVSLSIVLAIIFYGFIGKYYKKKNQNNK